MTCKSARASWDLGTLTLLCFQTATEKGTGKGDDSQGIRWTNYIPVGGLLPRAYLTLVAKLALKEGSCESIRPRCLVRRHVFDYFVQLLFRERFHK